MEELNTSLISDSELLSLYRRIGDLEEEREKGSAQLIDELNARVREYAADIERYIESKMALRAEYASKLSISAWRSERIGILEEEAQMLRERISELEAERGEAKEPRTSMGVTDFLNRILELEVERDMLRFELQKVNRDDDEKTRRNAELVCDIDFLQTGLKQANVNLRLAREELDYLKAQRFSENEQLITDAEIGKRVRNMPNRSRLLRENDSTFEYIGDICSEIDDKETDIREGADLLNVLPPVLGSPPKPTEAETTDQKRENYRRLCLGEGGYTQVKP